MSLLVFYLLSSWLPLLITTAGFSMEHASLMGATLATGGTVGRHPDRPADGPLRAAQGAGRRLPRRRRLRDPARQRRRDALAAGGRDLRRGLRRRRRPGRDQCARRRVLSDHEPRDRRQLGQRGRPHRLGARLDGRRRAALARLGPRHRLRRRRAARLPRRPRHARQGSASADPVARRRMPRFRPSDGRCVSRSPASRCTCGPTARRMRRR